MKIILLIQQTKDLVRFFVILMVPIASFGVAYSCIVNRPSSPLDFDALKGSLMIVFFQMFGELSLDELMGE